MTVLDIDWNQAECEVVIPGFYQPFSNIAIEQHDVNGGDTHAFYNQDIYFEPVKRVVVNNVTVKGIEGEIHKGAHQITIKSAALITSFWWRNYSHFLFDMVPMLKLLEGLSIDTILMPPNSVAPQILPYFVKDMDVQYLEENSSIGIDQLWLVSPNGPPSIKPPWVVDYIRHNVFNARVTQGGTRKLWISRDDAWYRKLVSDKFFESMLKAHEFEIISAANISFKEQVGLFIEADIVCGIHGAGFSNIVFCDAGSRMLEIFDPYWLNGVFRIVSGYTEMEWRYLIGENYPSPTDNFERNVKISTNCVQRKLEELL